MSDAVVMEVIGSVQAKNAPEHLTAGSGSITINDDTQPSATNPRSPNGKAERFIRTLLAGRAYGPSTCRRERHLKRLSDLRRCHPQSSQRDDHPDAVRRGPIRDLPRRRETIEQSLLALQSITANPLMSNARCEAPNPGWLKEGRMNQPV
jgi:hypothetical protein